MSDTSSSVSDAPRLTGRVKWFNNRSGFGFITVVGGEQDSQDIFVHYTSLSVNSEQYMYLVQGEYVEFELGKMAEGEKHEHQALKVTGVNRGVLMCETRRQNPRPRRRFVKPYDARDGERDTRRAPPSPIREEYREEEVRRERPARRTVPRQQYEDEVRAPPARRVARAPRPPREDDGYRYVTRRTNRV